MSNRQTVFLACPYGQVGGGMGSIMAYLASMKRDPSGRFELKRLESRGGGHIALSPVFLAFAVCRIFAEALRGYIENAELRLQHGSAGETRSQEFSWDRINQAVADTYLRLIRQKARQG